MEFGKQFLSYFFGQNDGNNGESSQLRFDPRKAVVMKIFVVNEKSGFLVTQNWNKKQFELRSFYKEDGVKYTVIKDQFERLSEVYFDVIEFSLLLNSGEDSEEERKNNESVFISLCDSLLLQLEQLGLKCELLRVALDDQLREKYSKILSLFTFDRLVLSNPNKFTSQELLDLKIAPDVIELRCGWLTSLPEDLTLFNRFKRVSFVLETFDGLESLLNKFYKGISENQEARGSFETIRFLRLEKSRIDSIPGYQRLSVDNCWQSVFRLELDESLVGVAGGADYYVIHFLPPNTIGDKFTKYRNEYQRKNNW